MPFLQCGEVLPLLTAEQKLVRHRQGAGLAPGGLCLQQLALPLQLAQGQPQVVALPLHPRHLPAEVAQAADRLQQLGAIGQGRVQLLPPPFRCQWQAGRPGRQRDLP